MPTIRLLDGRYASTANTVAFLSGLIFARVISGVAVGLSAATATAYLLELDLVARPAASGRRANIAATAANLGGIGFGPLVAGWLAEHAPHPLRLPYIVFGGAIAGLAVLVALGPDVPGSRPPRPPYRPQRIVVPRKDRSDFFSAVVIAMATFAIFGMFTSLVPSFLADILDEHSRAVAGLAVFVAFGSAAAAQIVAGRYGTREILIFGLPALGLGLGIFVVGVFATSLPVFLLGGVVTGAGAGLAFRAAMATASLAAPSGARAEVLAGFFVGAYVGMTMPALALGIAARYWPMRDVVLVFACLALATIVMAVGQMGLWTKRITKPS